MIGVSGTSTKFRRATLKGRYPNNIGEPRASVVIANIEVKPEYRGQGLARKVISELLQPCDGYGVLEIELVHNPEFAAHLVQQDFSAFGDNLEAGLNVGFSYYRAVERSA